MQAWPILVFGAPSAMLGLLACAVGVIFRQPWLLVVGGITLFPSSYYLGGHPGMEILLFLPVLPMVAALALQNDRRLLACFLMLPNAAAVLFLTFTTVVNLFGR